MLTHSATKNTTQTWPTPITLPHTAVNNTDSVAATLRLTHQWNASLIQSLQGVAFREQCPLAQILLAGALSVYARYSQQESILLNWQGSDNKNIFPLIFEISLLDPFNETLTKIRANLIAALQQPSIASDSLTYPIDKIDNYENTLYPVLTQLYFSETAQQPPAWLTGWGITLEWQDKQLISNLYAPAHVPINTLSRWFGHWQNLLESALNLPTVPVARLPLLCAAEWQYLINHLNSTPKPVSIGSVLTRWQHFVAQKPHDLAFISESDRYSHYQLNQKVNRLVQALIAAGVHKNTLVGVYVSRSAGMVISILAVLKAGGAYVPLDPSYPASRLAYMVADTQLSVLITEKALQSHLSAPHAHYLCWDEEQQEQQVGVEENAHTTPLSEPAVALTGDELAYVIYTSGSTGTPKGVAVTHRNLCHYVDAMPEPLQFSADSVYLHTASFGFSASVRQLFVPLCNGVPVVLASSAQRADPSALFALIQREKVTHVDFAPSYWRHCLEHLLHLPPATREILLNNRLSCILSSAEPLWSDLPYRWRYELGQLTRCVNMYGQTETVGMVTAYSVNNQDLLESALTHIHTVAIGRPIKNIQAYILDQYQQPVPIGIQGYLHVSGGQIARYYLNLPEKTAATFMRHPFSTDTQAILCNTGDLACFREEGTIEFIGRQDNQIKIRGFRVELGEIEIVLSKHPAIKHIAVLTDEIGLDNKRLVAHIIPADTCVLTQEKQKQDLIREWRNFAESHLFPYMVPNLWLLHAEFPRLPNGKLDRCALSEQSKNYSYQEVSISSESEQVAKLTQLWQQVLQLKTLNLHDNFFELGGDSLLAGRLIQAINQAFNSEFSVLTLFAAPTIAQFSQQLQSAIVMEWPKLQAISRTDHLPISATQHRLWFLDQLQPNNPVYNMLGVFRLRGVIDVMRLKQTFYAISLRQEVLRMFFKKTAHHDIEAQLVPTINLDFSHADLRLIAATVKEREQIAEQYCLNAAQQPFDLSIAPLWRVLIWQMDENHYWCAIIMHHIISDQWSYRIFLQELLAHYQANLEPYSIAPLPFQYLDFAAWQQHILRQQRFAQQVDYWLQTLANAPTLSTFPTDFPRPAQQNFISACIKFQWSEELTRQLKALSRAESTTLFTTLLTAFKILLHRYSEQDDLLIGLPVAYRPFPELESLMGFFANTVVVRSDLSTVSHFRQLLQQVKQRTLEAYSHQDVPFTQVVALARPIRQNNHNPLFQIMLSFLDESWSELMQGEQFTIERIHLSKSTSDFDLFLTLYEDEHCLCGTMAYDVSLFREETINRLLYHYEILLGNILQQPDKKISLLSFDTEISVKKTQAEWETFEL
ncbi:non-ribosomal peptide synthetase [Thioflexithrix psekupsensis]|uniref:Carrier domain-containing protein n=1 Tax=Thioflexithrix psekupsensis TaxID=1570016 RepID=A0A251XA97_9GAMM|nr:non-ribosomal peptide synthetase [Thioflexithrix psekupsensis]OUD15233.1 hypothetical protein TPSD3_01500 [Thioflexithrix psekupsensis]